MILIMPNLSCMAEDVRVHPIDILELVKTNQCAMSGWTRGKMALATLSPLPFTNETIWWGGQAGGLIDADGTSKFRANTKVGPSSCLATANFTTEWDA